MIVTVFRSRLKPDAQEEYRQWATRMSTLAREVPGYVSHKGFVAEDGERVTIVEFESEDAMRVWATHPEHVEAKKKGRSAFFSEYRVQVCQVTRDTADHWSRTVNARTVL
ncbi:antibiotic biosynthesis monooxygenase [Paraburkholderia bryophila]|uniref:antibiotic biosynthesis monooxygenase family protein n=1 Tax=Paraburkholderia bryophila TaxID=420952 RepID=UPI002349BAA8|nr:antibiotic biosynthesis monooxygenase [Paraburkholderia bryophila]WCM22505.1 antibiotic biosynthesis monooxygenase [Paraburkholderia bryophila]